MLVIKAIKSGNIVTPASPIPTPNFGVLSYGLAYLVMATQDEADILLAPTDVLNEVDVTPVDPNAPVV